MAESKNNPLRVAVLLSGRGSNFSALLDAIARDALPVEIVLVLSDQPSAAGLELARSRKLDTAVVRRRPNDRTNEEFNAELAQVLEKASPDLVVLAGFMRVLTNDLIGAFPGRIINIHPSLLPSFKGLSAQRQALEAGVQLAGCSVHVVVEELDSGPILAQAAVPVLPGDTEETLSARILRQEHRILPAVVAAIARGELILGTRDGAAIVEWHRHSPPNEAASVTSL